ncbi:MAG: NAD/NADP octopine/nopaline dehydrogenase family protein [Verrucomicrobiota bacterium]|nr:NAD/NADP octopine/nopaline dehydrogenase family protein [Verrucomicrobiota bacterium]
MSEIRDERILECLRRIREKGPKVRCCVVGTGHGGLAMAGHLGIMGFPVRLYNRTDENLHAVRWHRGIKITGAVEGFGPVDLATTSMAEAVAEADVIMVVVPATAHRFVAEQMAPCVRTGQIVVLNPGRTGGTLEFHRILRAGAVSKSVLLGETATFIYASRALSRSEARIFRIKNTVHFATLPAFWIPEVLPVLNQAFPQFAAGDNVLSTGMENIGAIFHPALTLLNAGWIETTRGDFDYYLGGVTSSVTRVLERLDKERVAVAGSLGIHTVSARDWLYLTYDSSGRDLCEAVQNTGSYRGIRAPQSIMHRYVTEDVPMSLVPLASIGNMLGVPVPTMEMVINLANMMHGKDYWAEGRTVERMGLAGMSVKAIRQLVVGIE